MTGAGRDLEIFSNDLMEVMGFIGCSKDEAKRNRLTVWENTACRAGVSGPGKTHTGYCQKNVAYAAFFDSMDSG